MTKAKAKNFNSFDLTSITVITQALVRDGVLHLDMPPNKAINVRIELNKFFKRLRDFRETNQELPPQVAALYANTGVDKVKISITPSGLKLELYPETALSSIAESLLERDSSLAVLPTPVAEQPPLRAAPPAPATDIARLYGQLSSFMLEDEEDPIWNPDRDEDEDI